jgi:uncharacterized membrane protein required for colicin V production
MLLISIIIGLVLFFSFVGGTLQGAAKSFFSLLSLIIAIPIAGRFFQGLASILSFLPGENWENFLSFFILLGLSIVILHFVFYIPRKVMEKIWNGGFIFRLTGGILNLLGAAIGFVLLTLVITIYPVWGWLANTLNDSGIIIWLISNFGFIQNMLPGFMRIAASTSA